MECFENVLANDACCAISVVVAVRLALSRRYLGVVSLCSKHIDLVKHELTLVRKAGISLNLMKCSLLTATIDYLGHINRPGHLKIASLTTDAIKRLKAPRNVTKLNSFFGYCDVLDDSYQHARELRCHPRSNLEEPSHSSSSWMGKSLKRRIVTKKTWSGRLVWRYWTLRGEWHWTQMLANVQVRRALLQEEPHKAKRPIESCSSLTSAERVHHTTQRKCVPIVWAVLLLR